MSNWTGIIYTYEPVGCVPGSACARLGSLSCGQCIVFWVLIDGEVFRDTCERMEASWKISRLHVCYFSEGKGSG